MRRKRWTRGGLFALLLVASTLALSGCSVQGLEKHLRFGWPSGVTQQGERMRVLWSWAGVAALALGVVVWGLMFWAMIRYRKKDERIPRQTKYNLAIELTCIAIPFVIVIVLFWRTVVVEDDVNHLSADPDVLVQVDAFKWNWQFEYHEVKNAAGQEVNQVYADSTDLTTGQSAAKSPLYLSTVGSSTQIPVLVLPENRTVQIIEHSEDVIHSFWVPEFLFKRDVIPYGTPAQQAASGLSDNRFEFTATSRGSFVGRCAELCGTYHSQMNFEVRVVTDQQFTAYLAALKTIGPTDPARQYKALIEAGVPGGGYATTTTPFDSSRTQSG